jgi:hypothetical protein
MATAVQIEVLIDDKGVVQGVNRVIDAVNKVPGAAKPAFNKLTEETKKRTTLPGCSLRPSAFTIPREVSKTIAAIPGLSTALASAFKASVILGFIASIGEALRNLDLLKAKALDLGLSIASIVGRHVGDELREQKIDKALEPMIDQVNALKKAAELAGKDGFSQIRDQLRSSNEELDLFKAKFDKTIAEQFGAGTATTTRIQNDASGFIRQARVFNEEAANRQVEALRRQNAQNLLSIEVQSELAGKNEIEKLRIQLAADLKKIDIAAGGDRSPEGAAQRAQQRIAIVKAEQAQENEAIRQELVAGIQAKLQAEAGAAKGEEAIQLEHIARLQAIAHDQQHTEVQLQNERLALEIETNAKIRDLRDAAADQVFAAEQKAAVAVVPEWERSNAQILADSATTNRQIAKLEEDTVINSQEADRLRAANWKETNAKMAQEYSSQFESLYNDITTGNLGNRIKEKMRKFFFDVLGQWAAALQQQRQQAGSSTSSGGDFLGALGGLLGIGGFGGGRISGGQPGPYGLPPGVSNNFAGDGGFNSSVLFPSGAGIVLGGPASASTPIDFPGSSPVGGASSGLPQKTPGILSTVINSGKLAPLALLGALTLGSKGGNSAIAAGGLVAALGLGALYGPSTAATIAAAPFAPFLGPLAGGLIGFGVGQQYGPVAGSLSGFGSGALTGFLAGGPIGAIVGGIVGGLVGLFSGLFGGGPSKKSLADNYINQNILPGIQQDLFSFEGFASDYASTMSDLEKIKRDSYSYIKGQWGQGVADSEWNKLVVPAITKAENQINTDQIERNRRASLTFGPPQFADGGVFNAGIWPGGAGPAILHNDERVMTARANRMFGRQLAAIEDAAASGASFNSGSPVVVNISAWDGASVAKWLRSGGIDIFASAVQMRRLEGRRF